MTPTPQQEDDYKYPRQGYSFKNGHTDLDTTPQQSIRDVLEERLNR